ncbi:hypothetical protein C2W62_13120 [Candidatus Entotheonella serta]|nr:hypothetical protein C2W62_13120 [Candidatus Entotheonella serta]
MSGAPEGLLGQKEHVSKGEVMRDERRRRQARMSVGLLVAIGLLVGSSLAGVAAESLQHLPSKAELAKLPPDAGLAHLT